MSSRLRKVSVHAWAISQYCTSFFKLRSELPKAKTFAKQKALFEELVRTLIDVGNALEESSNSPHLPKALQSINLALCAKHFRMIAIFISHLPDEWRATISREHTERCIHFCELALKHYESTDGHWDERANLHSTLATVYLQLEVGDIAMSRSGSYSSSGSNHSSGGSEEFRCANSTGVGSR